MTDQTEYDDPSDIRYLDKLKIQSVSGNPSPSVYANGKNQFAVQITVKASNAQSRPLKFSNSTWINLLNLRFAESDQKLNYKGNSGWCFTEIRNEYCKENFLSSSVSHSDPYFKDNTAIIILYVYTDIEEMKRIAVSVDTVDGKHFSTADNPSGAEKMFLTIRSIPKIDYRDTKYLQVVDGNYEILSNALGWTSRFLWEGPYKEHYDGVCKRKIVKIQPNLALTGLNKFQKHEITYKPIRNSDVNAGNLKWSVGEWSDAENAFDILKPDVGYPCAVVDRGGSDYQLNLWYSRKNKIYIDGHVIAEDTSYYYRFCPYAKEDHEKDDDEGVPSFLLYKFILPENNLKKLKWNHVFNTATIKVTDHYGNEGEFKVAFDDSEQFDKPGFV